MVEQCGIEVVECVKQDIEEHESIQVPLVVEKIQVDVGQITKRLSTSCSNTSTDRCSKLTSRIDIFDAPGGELCSQSDKQCNGRSGDGAVREVNFEASNEKYNADFHNEESTLQVSEMSLKFVNKCEINEQNGSEVCNASLENSLSEVIENLSETDISIHISDSIGPTEISRKIRSFSFCVQDDDTKKSDGDMECSPVSGSLHAQHDRTNQPELDIKIVTSLKNELPVREDRIVRGSCMDTSHPRYCDTSLKIVECNDTQCICHQHHGTKDCHSMSYTSLDETNKCNAAVIHQMSDLEHCGPLHNASLLDYTPASSTQHVFWKDEMHIIDTCDEEGREHQIHRKSSVYKSSENVLEGLHNIPIDSFVERSAAESSPLTIVKIAPSVHLIDDTAVVSDSNPLSCCAREKREQLAVTERKHTRGMRKSSVHQSRQEVKNSTVAKRGRRSSKAVKLDECMKSFSVVSRKTRSKFSKPAGSYAWWFSGPKIDKVSSVSENESRRECGSNKSKKVGTKREPKRVDIGDKAGTPSTCIRLKVKSMKAVDHNGSAATLPDANGCSPPKTTDCILDVVKESGGQLKGECNVKYNMKNRGWPVQDDYLFVKSKEADMFCNTLKLYAAHTSETLGGITNDLTRCADNVYPATSSRDDVEAVEGNAENRFLYPETSLDLEDIPEVGLAGRAEDGLLNDLALTRFFSYSGIQGSATSINFTYTSRKKVSKTEMPTSGGDCLLDSSTAPVISGESKQVRSCRPLNKMQNMYISDKSLPSLEILDTHMFPVAPNPIFVDTDHDVCDEPSQTFVSTEKNNDQGSGVLSVLDGTIVAGHGAYQSINSMCCVPEPNHDETTKTPKSTMLTKSISGVLGSGSKGIKTPEHDLFQKDLVSGTLKTLASDQIHQSRNPFAPEDGFASNKTSVFDVPDTGVANAWASCDDCKKWRRVPSSLADCIERTDCRWTCNDNMDKAFADCSIPQEMSDEAINQELELSDGDEDVNEVLDAHELERRQSKPKGPEQERWIPIKTNCYLHRRRKKQTIDEIMVCHCKPPRDGGLGCGEECLNRMLNIECVRGTCPCGDRCSNQQFQERRYAKLQRFKCGKKGYGLRSEEHICRGQFLIEYVGEVLDMCAYEARQKDYALNGHKHFYFMTLTGSEVIDACSKGNLGRFINHSCEPNCRTEKWMVNGEICVGFIAIRNIKKGEEVTFDYNYVRVFGAAAKKCNCGSSRCHGFIGGDPLNCEVVAHDSDEDPEDLVTVTVDRESDTHGRSKIISTTKNPTTDEIQDAVESTVIGSLHVDANGEAESSPDASTSSVSQSPNLKNSKETLHLTRPPWTTHVEDRLSKFSCRSGIDTGVEEKVTNKASRSYKSESSSLTEGLGNSLSESKETNFKTSPDNVEVNQERPRSPSIRKSAISSSLLKKKIDRTPNVTHKKSVPISSKSTKFAGVSGRHEVVQEKLNELLDSGGGISKRKEAPKGYLKLLILTTASDNSGNGEAIQSNRDLSMILDALLKTKSRSVLADIINKNGLQMLHNIMKQHRRDFNRTPILRKLLKVLEYLAENKILNLDHINGAPPCLGMESFAESVMALTEHRNKQVHQIARSFRDRWIHRPLRKFSCMEKGTIELPRGSSANNFSASNHNDSPKDTKGQLKKIVISSGHVDNGRLEGCLASSVGRFLASGSTGRKRKSRWDQDEWIRRDGSSVCLKESMCQYSTPSESLQETKIVDVASSSIDEVVYMDEDVPPGFTAPSKECIVSPSAMPVGDEIGSQKVNHTPDPCEVCQGHPLKKLISRYPVSYAMPISILNQDVASQNGSMENWEISPSMPFHPFPPLPLYPRAMIPPPGCSFGSVTIEAPEGKQNCGPSTSANDRVQRGLGASTASVGGCHINRQYCHKRAKGSPIDVGKTYFRQKKILIPPWMRRRQANFFGNSSKNMLCNGGAGNLSNGTRNFRSDDGSKRMGGSGTYNFPQDHGPQNNR
ncbi:unnamed protein product [Rhodiola kirilowii]